MTIHTFVKLKKVAAFILMLCFVLPLSQCSGIKVIAVDGQPSKQVNAIEKKKGKVDPFIPVKVMSIDEPVQSLMLIFCFFFSLPFILFSKKVKSYVNKILVYGLDLLFAGFSAYILIMSVVVIREPLIAGYLSLLAIASYLLSTLYQLIYTIKRSPEWNKI